LALGEAMVKALGSKKGINRYGFLLPMDDAMAQVAVDFGGRPWMEWNGIFKRERVGDVPTEMIYHFFKSFSDASKCNLNIKVTGENEHHMIEGIFKAFAKAIKMAIKKDPEALNKLPSTKGVL
jgi:imidazoleglycerol-phosphate dehydratase/histidinol-phosphatase